MGVRFGGESVFDLSRNHCSVCPGIRTYLFTVLNWTNYLKIDLGKWPALRDYMVRVAARPAVKETMKAEGLIK